MKKTISISIANTLFYIEEDAYAKLDEYLRSIRAHFASYPDRDDIVADIESRIAEQFSAKNKKIVSLEDVDDLVKVMGEASEFGDSAEEPVQASGQPRRLYRNPDDVMIAGVCSGIAAYAGFDPAVVRIIFILSLLFGGTGAVLYIVLWIAMPEARSATEKLQMHGDPVTIDSVGKMVKEKAEEFRSNEQAHGRWRKAVSLPFAALRSVIDFFARRVAPVLGKLIGAILLFVCVVTIVALLAGLAIALFNYPAPYIDFPLGEVAAGSVYYVALLSGFAAIGIPFVFVLLFALTLIRGRSAFGPAVTLSFLAVWIVAASVFAAVSVRLAAQYDNMMTTDPSYRESSRQLPAEGFSSIEVKNGQRLEYVQGTTTSVIAVGRERDLERVEAKVEDGTLVLERRPEARICIFCWTNPVKIRVTSPTLQGISARNGSSVNAASTTFDGFELELANGSSAHIEGLRAGTLALSLENSSHARLSGTTTALSAELRNASNLSAQGLAAERADVAASNGSTARLLAAETLKAYASNGSDIRYSGNPELDERATNGSTVRRVDFGTRFDESDFSFDQI